jgi:hypothetical protein
MDLYRVIFEDEDEQLTAVVAKIEIMMGPEKETIVFHEWKKLEDGNVKWFTDEYQPVDNPDYEFVETKNIDVNNGEAYEITIIGSFDGEEVAKYTPEDFPEEGIFKWYDTRVKKLKIPGKEFEPNVSSIKGLDNLEITARVTNQEGVIVGSYLPNYNSGNLVFVFESGQVYEFTIEAEGFQMVKEQVAIMSLGDYQKIINKRWLLVENGLEAPAK